MGKEVEQVLRHSLGICRDWRGTGRVLAEMAALALEELIRVAGVRDRMAAQVGIGEGGSVELLRPGSAGEKSTGETASAVAAGAAQGPKLNYIARTQRRPEPDREAAPARVTACQGSLLEPATRGPWSALFREFGEFVHGEQIAAVLRMDTSTFYQRRLKCDFPPPKFEGRQGRGLKHTWLTRDVLTYLNYYSGMGQDAPIMLDRVPRRGNKRRKNHG